jgi:hypothetical protein
MKTRSPVLGYNHNVRYAGRLWHVQTEDSGVQNPHVFTHLFHEGTILATKRIDYDPASEVGAVQKIMQAQHKAMLRELKAGSFDDKIVKFFGEPIDKSLEESTDPNAAPPIVMIEAEPSTTGANIPEVHVDPPRPEVTQPRYSGPATDPTNAPAPQAARPAPQQPAARPPTAKPIQRPVAGGGIGSRRVAAASAVNKPSAEGVVVARPAVIIGGEPQQRPVSATAMPARKPVAAQPAAPPAPPPAPSKTPSSDNIFGADLISEKSLDEVILAYLSEDLNDK